MGKVKLRRHLLYLHPFDGNVYSIDINKPKLLICCRNADNTWLTRGKEVVPI